MAIISKPVYEISIADFKPVQIELSKMFEKIIKLVAPYKNPKQQTSKKYNDIDFIRELIRFVKSGSTYWSKFDSPISGLHKKHKYYCSINAYAHLYLFLLTRYKKHNNGALKIQSIDSKFVKNIMGTEYVDRNPHYKNKNGFKLSQEVDSNGVWYSTVIGHSSESDIKLAYVNYDNRILEINTLDASKNNKHKQYYLADKGYDSRANKQFLTDMGYTPIIATNKRNARRQIRKMTQEEKKKYMSNEL